MREASLGGAIEKWQTVCNAFPTTLKSVIPANAGTHAECQKPSADINFEKVDVRDVGSLSMDPVFQRDDGGSGKEMALPACMDPVLQRDDALQREETALPEQTRHLFG
jgi:hypothetical protein